MGATNTGTPDIAVAQVYAPGVISPAPGWGRQFPTPGTAAGLPAKMSTPILGVILILLVLLYLERRRLRLTPGKR